MKKWIVVAGRAETKIFEQDSGDQPLRWLKTLVHKKGRRRERDFNSDKPGFSYARFAGNFSPHGLSPHHTHAEVEATHFAHKIAKIIKAAYEKDLFDKGIIFASPKFLGQIKKELKHKVRGDCLSFIGKNIESLATEEISNRIK